MRNYLLISLDAYLVIISTMQTVDPTPDYNNIMRLSFGTYVQVLEEPVRKNSMQARTLGAIALYPAENQQGSWYFLCLATGEKIHRGNCPVLPISDEVIS